MIRVYKSEGANAPVELVGEIEKAEGIAYVAELVAEGYRDIASESEIPVCPDDKVVGWEEIA